MADYNFKLVIGDQEFPYSPTKYTLYGVRFNRKIYQPGEIEAEVNIDPEKTIDELTAMLLGKKVTLMKGDQTLAENYYVQEILPQKKKGITGIYVRLYIYSMDKLATLDKYSKVYAVKKLGAEILNKERTNFTLGTEALSVKFDNLRMLKYMHTRTMTNSQTGKSISIKIPSEFIHPYLVQYNESFYDFLARTANRCGEFLYFEDGRLNLGLTPSRDSSGNTVITKITGSESVTYQGVSTSHLDINRYARDSMKDKWGMMEETNYDVSRKNAAGYPHDVFPSHTSYHSELAADEFFFPLYAEKFSTYNREIGMDGTDGERAATQMFPKFADITANMSDIVDFAVKLTLDEGKTIAAAKKSATDKNNDGKEAYIEIGDTADRAKLLERGDGENCAVPFGTLSKDGWTTLDYYRDVRKYEEQQQRGIICIDMGTNFADVKLGDTIKLDGDTLYTVIQIVMVDNTAWNLTYMKYDGDGGSKTEVIQNQKIFAIPQLETKDALGNHVDKPYPPVLDVPVVRKAEPQTAFVADNKDPKYQGRVRIVYPWQTDSTGKMKELADAEAAYAEEVRKQTEKKERLAQIKAELEVLKKERADLESIRNAATNDEKNKIIQKKKDEKDEAVKDLQKKIAAMQKIIDNPSAPATDEKDKAVKDLKDEIAAEQKIINDPKAKAEDKEKASKKKAELEEQLKELARKKKANLEEQLKDQLIIQKEQEAYINLLEKSKTDDTILEQKIAEIEVKDNKRKLTGGKQKEYNDLLEEIKKAEGKDGTLTNAEEKVKTQAKKCSKAITAVSSPWIRMTTPMATDGGGTLFKPRVGDEVLVNYECGNVERPYVVGSLFSKNVLEPDERINRTVGPALHSGASIAIVSPNGHGITFKDPGSGDGFVSSVYPGLGIVSKYSDGKGWGKKLPQAKDLAGGIRIGDRYGLYAIDMSSDKRSVRISSSLGTVRLDAFTGITITAPNGDVRIEGKNVTIKAGNNLNISSGNNIDTRGKLAKKFDWAGKVDVVEGIGKKLVSQALKDFVTPFVDVSLARSVWEMILKPVEGTTLIKSRRYLKLEAGSGKAMIQHDRYTSKYEKLVDTSDKLEKTEKIIKQVVSCITDIDTLIKGFCATYEANWKDCFTKRNAYFKASRLHLKDKDDPDIWEEVSSLGDWQDYCLDDKFDGKFKDGTGLVAKRIVIFSANAYGRALFTMNGHLNYFKVLYNPGSLVNLSQEEQDAKNAMKDAFDKLKNESRASWSNFCNNNPLKFLTTAEPTDVFADPVFLKRKWAAHLLAELSDKKDASGQRTYEFVFDCLGGKMPSDSTLKDNYKWNSYVSNLEKYKMGHPLLRAAFDTVIKKPLYEDTLKPFANPVKDLLMWNEKEAGDILLSQDPDWTVDFKKGKANGKQEANTGNLDWLKKKLYGLK